MISTGKPYWRIWPNYPKKMKPNETKTEFKVRCQQTRDRRLKGLRAQGAHIRFKSKREANEVRKSLNIPANYHVTEMFDLYF